MIIQIGKYNIEIKEALSWYDTKEIEAVMIGGAKMDIKGKDVSFGGIDGHVLFDSKLKLFELVIKEIKEGDKVIKYSMDWVKNLTPEEGDLLDKTIDEKYKAEKKS